MPTVTRVLVKEKTGFSPADKKQRGDTQGCDQGTDRDLSTETEIRGLNITPFVPPSRPSDVTGSSSIEEENKSTGFLIRPQPKHRLRKRMSE